VDARVELPRLPGRPAPDARPAHAGQGEAARRAPAHLRRAVVRGLARELSYRWGVPRFRGQLIQAIPHPLRAIEGATSKHFTRGARTRGKKLACAVTARNAGGDWTVFSKSVAG
jgi:hypothetical protein